MQKNILITGQPRSGKSTLLDKIIADIPKKVGFVTKEVLTNGERTGFELETHLGTKAMLADVHQQTPYKFSKYFVQVEALETLIPEVALFGVDDVLYLDEIAPLELFSDKFKQLVLQYMDSPNICLATIKQNYADDFIESIKKRPDVVLVEITPENRNEQEQFLKLLIGKIRKARGYISERDRFTRKDSKMEIRSEHGTRNLALRDGKWECDCNFFQAHNICSHSIATSEFTKST